MNCSRRSRGKTDKNMYNRCTRIAMLGMVMVVLGVFLLPVCVQTSVYGEENRRVVRVGYIDYPGFIEQQEDGSYDGYGVRYLNEISKYTHWSYEYVYDSCENQLENLKEGKIDLICHAQKTTERENTYLFSTISSGAESSILYVREDDDRFFYNDYDAFDGMKVAMQSNSFQNLVFANYAKNNGFQYESIEFDTDDESIQALDQGKVDAVVVGSLDARTGYKEVSNFGSEPYYFMTGLANQELMDELNSAMAQIKATDQMFDSRLYEKYYGGAVSGNGVRLTRDEYEFIQESGTIPVAVIDNRIPISDVDEKGKVSGITVDILNEIQEQTGLKFAYTALPSGVQVTDYLKEHDNMLIAGVLTDNTALKNENYLMTDSYYTSNVVIATKNGTDFQVKADEGSYRLAIPASYMGLKSYVTRNCPQFTVVPYSTTDDCLKALEDGEVDFVAQNMYILSPKLQNPHYDNLSLLPNQFMVENLSMLCNYNEQNVMLNQILNKAINTISADSVNQIVINNTANNIYHLSIGDVIYKYRLPLAGLAVLILFCAALALRMIAIRQKAFTQITAKNKQLAEAVAQAEDANCAKSMFLARMSHEIRTPMNAIVGITSISRHHLDNPTKMKDYLEKIEISSKLLLNIINDILDMSAIESNKMKIASNPINMRELLASITTVYYPQCQQKGVRFNMFTADIRHERLMGDGLRINQILMNLVSNAYKFTPTGGSINITVSETMQRENEVFFKFVVADTGIGMSPEMLERLFKPFEQESASTAQKHGGSGLGLSIAKNLVNMMHGSISVESEKDRGSRFTVNLPFEIIDDNELLGADKLNTIRALIVDDDQVEREYTATVLERIGVAHDIAVSGEAAIHMLENAKKVGVGYDICFVDWKMPGLSGLDVTKKIRDLFQKDTLIIVVSAYDVSEVEEEAQKAGVDMFVSKPLFQSTVFNLMMSLSGGHFYRKGKEEISYDFSGKKLLLAEDTEFNREIAVELLNMVNMEVDCAVDGQEAVDMFLQAPQDTYCAILMDIQIPKMDGYEATKKIRSSNHPQACKIPIFAMTANAFAEDVSAALDAGMDGHIAKPIELDILYKTLGKAIL